MNTACLLSHVLARPVHGLGRTQKSCRILVWQYWIPAGLLTTAGAFWAAPRAAGGGEPSEMVAVYASVSPDYARARLPDGSFKTETYAFGKGGALGAAQKDGTFDRMGFMDLARVIARSLASQDYVPCNPKDPNGAGLLIMVYWGTTIGTDGTASGSQYQMAQTFLPPSRPPPPPVPKGGAEAMTSDPNMSGRSQEFGNAEVLGAADDSALQQSAMLTAAANRQRDQQDMENASVLGYLPEMQRVASFQMAALASRRQDIIDEIEESRYYVVLLAYDFKTLWQHKQRKLLWETRFSIRERRNDFSESLASMAQDASRYFGQDSHGLIREHLPDTRIILGEPKVLGYEPATSR